MRIRPAHARPVLACCIAALITCDRSGNSSTKGQAMLDRVSLTAEFSLEAERVVVRFQIANDRDADVYVVDRAFDVGPTGATVRRDHLSVKIEGDTAVLSSVIVLPDPSVAFAAPPVFYTTRVPPRQRHRNDVSARLPLRPDGWRTPRTPEGEVLADKILEGRCTRVRFELGVVPGVPEVALPVLQVGGVEVVQLDVPTARMQAVLTAEWRDVSVRCSTLAR
jgi:hypothetical protein